MNDMTLACPCLFGLESLVADECRRLGFADVTATNGRVTFRGDEAALARANLNLRCAERVLVLLGEFEAKTFDSLFEGVRALPWERLIGREDEFPVKGWSLNSALHSIPDCQAIIKKAVVERLKAKYGVAWFKETGPKHQIRFSILKDTAAVYLDTSGDGLHKRGYRADANEAPLKETLAAALVMLSRFRANTPFYDPMCGSGTILIEAALLGAHIAPGLNRRFAAERWGSVSQKVWADARSEALANVSNEPFSLQGYDIDPKAVSLTLANAHKAGVGKYVRAQQQDITLFAPQEPRGTIVCNPPYGERMLEVTQAEQLYHTMGQVFLRLEGFHYYIIAPSGRFETLFGKKADKRRKLYNGMLKCELFEYFRGPAVKRG